MSTVSRVDLGEHRKRCTSCHARVIWTWTDEATRMPVDDGPAPNGNVLLMRYETRIVAAVLSDKEARRRRAKGIPLYLSHFATCPNAERHRRR